MTYPDGEVVTYHYNEAGQVESLTSNKLGRESVIIERTGYDKDGHTVYTKLGNGTETEYTYDDVRQRLQEMNLTASGNPLMQNKYEYDKVDNILGISNNINPQSLTQQNKAKLGGSHSHSYQYDELNRLIHATGKAKSASYDMAMTFNSMSMPLTKVQNVDSTTTAQSYNNTYLYEDSNHPTAPTQIGHDHYEYDANGNPTMVVNDSLNTTRELYWDEDNRLMVLSDNGKTSRYTYNHAGERIVKSHGDMEGVYINGAPQGITFHETDEFTLYPAPIISISKNRFTKHYFIGDKRVASRIGTGKFNNVYGRNGSYVTAGQQNYAERMNQIESQKEDYYKELGIAPGVPTMKGAYGDPENTGVGYNTIITELGDHSVPEAWAQYAKHNDKEDSAPGAPIAWDAPVSPEEPEAGYGFVADDSAEPEETFFYHSDHLGSTSYITDDKGNITQYDAYLPYGELLVDEHTSSEEMPYKFNGKELDEETGLYYYGARYLNPISSVFLNTDRYRDKYPSLSAYSYCAGNPINAIDVNGDSIWVRQFNPEKKSWDKYHYDIDASQFKDANGNAYNGANNVLDALNTLASKPAGNELVSALSSSTQNVLIIPSSNRNSEGGNAEEYASCVKWIPNKDAAFGGGSFISLGHELAHSLDRINGTMDMNTWYSVEGEKGEPKHIPNAEKYATHFENRIRAEHGVKLRTHYSKDTNNNPSGGRILRNGNHSIFFDSQGNHAPKYKRVRKNNYIYK